MPDQSQEKAAADAAKAVAQQQPQPKAKPADEAPAATEERYDAAGWRARSRSRLGVSPHAVVGAAAGQDPEATFTESEIRKLLDEFSVQEGVS